MRFFFICFFSFLGLNTFSQADYKQMMDDYSINFYEVCKAAEKYFETHDKEVKGSGWKPFQRWKNANEFKYYPDGDRSKVGPYFVENEFQKFQNNTPKTLYPNGWNELGPLIIDSLTGHYSVGLGRIEDFYVNPLDSTNIYLGSRSGGFWKTVNNNGNITWDGGSTDFLVASGVNTIGVSPTNSDSILINIRNSRNGMSHGIYRSVDGGDNWTQSNFNPTNLGQGGLGEYFKIYKVIYHPTISNLVFVGTSSGIFRSDDNLQTWTNLFSNGGDVTDIAFHPTNPNIIYIYDNDYWGTNQNVVLKSTDLGLSYISSSTISGNNDATGYLSVSNDCSNCVYFASNNGVWKSVDEGQNFTFLNNPSQSCDGFAVNDLDTSHLIYGYVDLEGSSDGGQTFNQITYWSLGNNNHNASNFMDAFHNSQHYIHADLRVLRCINGVFYAGTDGLLCKSNDNGNTWVNLSEGIGIRENYKLGVSQSNHYRSIVGSQDNGTSIKHKDTWVEFYGADGMAALIHPLNGDWMMSSHQYGGRRRTTDGGQSGSGCSPSGQSGSGSAAWEAPLKYDPNNHMRVFSFSDSVFVSEDFAVNWSFVGIPSSFSGTISEAAIAENNSDIIVISKGSEIDKSTDGGVTFTSIKNNLPDYTITDIAFAPNDDNIIIVTYARYQFDNSKVFISSDGGQNWSNITYNLGDMPILSVVIDHSDAANIYLGAEIGIYTKPMNSGPWTLYNPNLPNTSLKDLEIVYGSNTIRTATWGRGVWEYSLVGRNDFPAILLTDISNSPTQNNPKEGMDQYVTSLISYDNTLSSVYVEWSENSSVFGNVIPMINTQDSTWVSQSPLPNFSIGTKLYFKVFAVGDQGDTTETYKFMYTVTPFEYCASSGTMTYQGNVTLVNLNTINNPTGKTQPYTNYTSAHSTDLNKNQSYDLTVNLNTDNGNYTYFAKAWIDWNKDAEFDDATESYELGSVTNNVDGQSSLCPFSITVPSTAIEGATRMRVSCLYNAYPSPCANGFDGEVEDYEIVVVDPAAGIDSQKNLSLLYSPNPVIDILDIDLLEIAQEVDVLVYDVNMKLVLSLTENQKQKLKVNMSSFDAGIYFIEVLNKQGRRKIKVVKS
ncbi:MAG: GEVED domain-containing protein [Crocinitomicaceae bacterium]|nr:GEVED domain-containing protein [Crocinitomicaceae bacterium]